VAPRFGHGIAGAMLSRFKDASLKAVQERARIRAWCSGASSADDWQARARGGGAGE